MACSWETHKTHFIFLQVFKNFQGFSLHLFSNFKKKWIHHEPNFNSWHQAIFCHRKLPLGWQQNSPTTLLKTPSLHGINPTTPTALTVLLLMRIWKTPTRQPKNRKEKLPLNLWFRLGKKDELVACTACSSFFLLQHCDSGLLLVLCFQFLQ